MSNNRLSDGSNSGEEPLYQDIEIIIDDETRGDSTSGHDQFREFLEEQRVRKIQGPFLLGRFLLFIGACILAAFAFVVGLALVGSTVIAGLMGFKSPVYNGRVKGYWFWLVVASVLALASLVAVISPSYGVQIAILFLLARNRDPRLRGAADRFGGRFGSTSMWQ